ncbi:hypothetical protein KUTeg_018962 [Tegillarca granosa]|uniref:CCR4-NOT transcription complex subunit 1 n=1 Tax=Tegillarca granosa TaxID=220873 RepID=A0ABQ9EDR9_TEGGR|nr:hypothetical protein KUTeg_018962 [Tegillarca granosa]
MNLDSLSFALAEISYSVANLTKKNFKSSVGEITHLVSQHGSEADRHLFRCLFSHVDFSGDGRSSGKDFHQSLRPSPQLFPQISKVLKLSRVQEVIFGLALLNSSNSDTRLYASQFVKQKLPDLLRSYIDADIRQEGGLQDVAIEVLHLLLTNLFKTKDHFGIGDDQREAFLKTLKKDFPHGRVPVILGPLLYPEAEDIIVDKLSDTSNMPKSVMATSLADMILEAGYGCTASVEECRSNLIQFGAKEITPASVAKVLGMMARTPSGLTEQSQGMNQASAAPGSGWDGLGDKTENPGVNTWNVEVFSAVIQDLAPHLSWRDVVLELDHAGFIVMNKRGFRILIQGLIRGLQEVFPVEFIYRPWKNTEGQLSFVVQSLRNPDVFCFADYPCHTVVIDILKAAPDDDNRDIATWKSLDLVESLLRLSDAGHYQQVSELFKFPIQNCPDMLVLALLQITPTWNTLKQELIPTLMPIFLGNHPNSAVVLHYAWHCQGHSSTIRTLIMHSMAEWYMRGEQHDQTRLSRILDVAQDLKALSMLLNATPFAFVIDLACLASRREYLKLDKWLTDKIREHGEPFIQTGVNFLKRRCPQLLGGPVKDDLHPQAKSQMLPPDTITTMLNCLQQCASQVSQELSEAIYTMLTNANVILNKPRPPPPTSVVGTKSTLPNLGPGNMASQIEGLDSNHPLGIPKSWGVPGGVNAGFPQALPPLTTTPTPGSPAKGLFQPLSQANDGLGTMQNLTLQYSGLNLGGQMGPPRTPGVNPLSVLGSQAVAKQTQQQQPQQPQQPQQQPPPTQPQQPQNPDRIRQDEVLDMLKRFKDSPNRQEKLKMDVQSVLQKILDTNGYNDEDTVDKRRNTSNSGQLDSDISSSSDDDSDSDCEDDSLPAPETNLTWSKHLRRPNVKQFDQEVGASFEMGPNKKEKDFWGKFFPESLVTKLVEETNKYAEKDVYECMLRNLFEEYRFFPQYPERELHTTAVLFGGIIEKGLATYMALGIALRYVLEALKKPHNSKMYFFGIAALDRFKSRLKDYPQYCQHLAAIPHFQQFPVHLIEFVEYGSRSQEPPLMSQVSRNTPTVPPPIIPTVTTATITTESLMTTAITTAISSATTPVSAAAAIAAASNTKGGGTLPKGKEEFSVPPETVQDKVFFIFNNLSQVNMVQKAEELKKEVTEEYMPWVAQYLVMKRASIEPNFHTLYASFLDALQLNKLANMVIRETFRNIKVLLRSDKGDANFSDRTLLKNLGHWLGMLMLAKNKPILAIDIDLKALIYEAYHKGARELLYVVPFAAKVLESCAKSKVFRPPNPWTLGIMNVLAELHMEQDLKLNLKFEIEDLKPGTYLKDESRLADIMPQLSGKTMTPQPEPAVPVLTATTPTVTTTTITTPTSTTTPNMPPQPQFAFDDIVTSSLSGISSHIIINDQVALFQGNPQLKQIVKIAIEKSIQELLPPVVERTIKITLTTCEQIIKKDFALDPEETRMSAAAHHMIRNMTAGLSLITCREPLTISIQTNLKNAFMNSLRGATQQQKELIEQSAQVIAQDNTELACAFIQKTAVERAIPEINKRLATEFELRKHARSEGRRYCDPVVLTYQAERMPEQIRLKVGGVTQSQISVYEEFAHNIPGFLPTGELTFPSGGQPKPMQPPVLKFPSSNAAPELKSISLDEISQIYEKIAREMEQHLQHLIGIPPGNPLVGQLQGLLEAVALARNSHDIAAARALIQKAVEALLEHYPNPNSADQEFLFRFRECNLLVLKGLQDQRAYGPQWINKQVTRCLIEIGDEYKYNFEAIDLLIRSQLVNLQQYDLFLAQHMENGANYMAVGFAMQLVQRYCVDEKHNTPVTETIYTVRKSQTKY